MAAINLNPSLQVNQGLAGAEVRPAVQIGDWKTPSFSENVGGFNTIMDVGPQIAEANQRRIDAEQKARKLKNDEKFNTLSTPDQAEVLGYQREYGGIPRTTFGDIDLETVRGKMGELARIRHSNALTSAAMFGVKSQIVPKLNPATGHLEDYHLMTDEVSGAELPTSRFMNTFTTLAQGQGAGGVGAGQKSAAAQQEALEQQARANQFVGKLQQMKALVLDPDLKAVGPAYGSSLGRFTAAISGFFGQLTGNSIGSTARTDAQGTLNRFLSGQTMELTPLLKGPLSEKELAFLRKSVPEMSTSPTMWNAWLDELNEFYQTRIAALQERVAAGQPEPGYYSQEAVDFMQQARQLAAATPTTPGLGKAPVRPAP